ncbi:hypothetical protein [Vibrio sp. LQ2]|nr:hypothetical protein [Vibrio sp. LQ2]
MNRATCDRIQNGGRKAARWASSPALKAPWFCAERTRVFFR